MMKSNRLAAMIFGTAMIAMSASPLMAQDAPAPANAPAATTTTPTVSGPTSGSDSEVKDADVFGFDISGATQPTAEQLVVAKNTCNEKVNTEPTRYSGAVRTFCEQVLKMN
jgi:hypothetical protein